MINTISELVQAAASENWEEVINFGKHKGKLLKEIPNDYIKWAKENQEIDEHPEIPKFEEKGGEREFNVKGRDMQALNKKVQESLSKETTQNKVIKENEESYESSEKDKFVYDEKSSFKVIKNTKGYNYEFKIIEDDLETLKKKVIDMKSWAQLMFGGAN